MLKNGGSANRPRNFMVTIVLAKILSSNFSFPQKIERGEEKLFHNFKMSAAKKES